MSEYTPVEEVIRAWVIRGSHPGYHEFQKNLLRENWPILYNAIERLVSEEINKSAKPSASTGKTVSQDERAGEIDRWLIASAEATKRHERDRIIALLESLKGTCSGDCDDCRPYAQISDNYLTEVIALINGEKE